MRVILVGLLVAMGLMLSGTANAGKTTRELGLNLFGDAWETATQAGFTFNFVAGDGCYRKPGYATTPGYSAEMAAWLTAFNPPYLWESCMDLKTQGDAGMIARIAAFRAALPSRKFIAYMNANAYQTDIVGMSNIWDETSGGSHTFFLWRAGQPNTFPNNIVRDPSNQYMLDMTNASYRTFIITRIVLALIAYDIDGIVFDGVQEFPIICVDPTFECTSDQTWIPVTDPRWTGWAAGYKAFFTELKTAIAASANPNIMVFANVVKSGGETFILNNVFPYMIGVSQEDMMGKQGVANDNVKPIDALIINQPNVLQYAVTNTKWILVSTETKINGDKWREDDDPPNGDGSFSNADGTCVLDGSPENLPPCIVATVGQQHARARYYVAAYHIFNNGRWMFKFDHPTDIGDQYTAAPYYKIFSLNVGAGTSSVNPTTKVGSIYKEAAGTNGDTWDRYVWKRTFNNGLVVLNTTDATYAFTVPAGGPYYDEFHVQKTGTVNILARTGLLLYTAAAFPATMVMEAEDVGAPAANEGLDFKWSPAEPKVGVEEEEAPPNIEQ